MLSRTSQTARLATRQARRYATTVDAGGVRVATMEPNAPTASLTLLLKAGTRYETKAGQANALKHFAFKVCFIRMVGMDVELNGCVVDYGPEEYAWYGQGD
jgi:predicted Zn-dependent peptidase